MKIQKLPLGQMGANCYLLIHGDDCLIIDPGDEASFILDKILRLKLNPVAILATHGHFDHLMAAGEIQLSYDIPFYIFEEDLFLINRLDQTAEYFLNMNSGIVQPRNIKHFKEGKMQILNFEFEVIKTPGHTPGGCCLYFPKENVVLTGDILFKNAIGRYDFTYSDKEKLKESINKLFKLPDQTIVYSGHGEDTILGEEKPI